MAFPKQVQVTPAPGVAGQFASTNPRVAAIAGPGGYVAGPNGCIVGNFGWGAPPPDANGTTTLLNSTGVGAPVGFVAENLQALITTYLGRATLVIPSGFMVVPFTEGDFWAANAGTTEAVQGQKAFARYSDGGVIFGAAGTIPLGASATGSTIAANTTVAAVAFTAAIAGDIMTVSAVATGTLYPGSLLATGPTGLVAGTTILSQLTGTAGSTGTYLVSVPEQTVASGSFTATYGIFTPGTTTGTFGVGDVLSGSGGGGVAAGTTITALISAGVWAVNLTQTVTSTTISAALAYETKFYAQSGGLPGEVVKISSWPQG